MLNEQKGTEFDAISWPVFSLDGDKLAYAAMQNEKYFVVLNDNKGYNFESVSNPIFSPDGKNLAYAAMQNGKWFVVFNNNKGPDFDLVYGNMSFNPTGDKIAYVAKVGTKSFVMINDKRCPEFFEVHWPTFSPQGDKVAYYAVKDEKDSKVFVVVFDMKSSGFMKGPEFDNVSGPISFSSDGKKLAYIAHKGYERYVVLLEIENNNIALKKTFGPLQVHIVSSRPYTDATVNGEGWGLTFNHDGSKIAYGINAGGGIRMLPQSNYYYVENIMGNCAIEINGHLIAQLDSYGLVTPFSFSDNDKQIHWMVLKDRKIYSKKIELKLDYNDIEIYYNHGIEKSKIGNYEGAIKDFLKVLEYNPENPDVLLELGKARYAFGDKKSACEDFKKASEFGSYEATELINKYCK